jgi:hypothetical protein
MKRVKYGQFRHAGAALAGASILIASPAFALASTRAELSVSATVVRPCTFSSGAVLPTGPGNCGDGSSPAFAMSSAQAESVRTDTNSGNIVYATFTY